jgi:hypothetical protein
MDMSQLAIDVTMTVDAAGTSAQLNQVKNALGHDITDIFRSCKSDRRKT